MDFNITCSDIRITPNSGYSIEVTLSDPDFDVSELLEYVDKNSILDEINPKDLLERVDLNDMFDYLVDSLGGEGELLDMVGESSIVQYHREKRLEKIIK